MSFLIAVFIIVTSSAVITSENANFKDDFVPYSLEQDRFAWTMIKRVASKFKNTFVMSPIGLKLSLSVLKEGALGDTLAELTEILSNNLNRTENRESFKNIIELLQKDPKRIAYLYSWIFVSSDFKERKRFQAIGEVFYNTDIKTVNTNSNFAGTAEEINSVVYNKTAGSILNPVTKDDVADMRLLILNTLYFKAAWTHQFPKTATFAGDFYVSPSTVKIVPFMNVVNNFNYAESSKFDAKILRMPYLGNEFAMYFIVPNTLTGLSYVLENIKLLPLELQRLGNHVVDVTLPKFKITYTLYLEKTLREMGLSNSFQETASFPGIASSNASKKVNLSKVMQTILIDVNESGTGVPTAEDPTTSSNLSDTKNTIQELILNRPSFFFVQDETSRQLVVFGRIADF